MGRKLEFSVEEIKQAKDELYRLSRDKNELELYSLREKSFNDKVSALSNAEEKGEKKKAIEIAKNMISKGVNIEMILEFTGLTIEEINIINANIKNR